MWLHRPKYFRLYRVKRTSHEGGILVEQKYTLSPELIELNETVDVSFESALNALVVVAHPDDESLWVGGLMLMCFHWRWTVVSLYRGSDTDRRTKFFKALKLYGARGRIADLDDGPMQTPLGTEAAKSAIRKTVGEDVFDLIITHDLRGEYTRHLRHEETSLAVTELWHRRDLRAKELWYFAYSDNRQKHLPKAIEDAHLLVTLPDEIWHQKRKIIGDVYGFSKKHGNTGRHHRWKRFGGFSRDRRRNYGCHVRQIHH